MKAIYTDIQELQTNAMEEEEFFISYVQGAGWTSPTENEIRAARAAKKIAEMSGSEKTAALAILNIVGIEIPALDFPIRGNVAVPIEQASAA
jgi:hypothetical protein